MDIVHSMSIVSGEGVYMRFKKDERQKYKAIIHWPDRTVTMTEANKEDYLRYLIKTLDFYSI